MAQEVQVAHPASARTPRYCVNCGEVFSEPQPACPSCGLVWQKPSFRSQAGLATLLTQLPECYAAGLLDRASCLGLRAAYERWLADLRPGPRQGAKEPEAEAGAEPEERRYCQVCGGIFNATVSVCPDCGQAWHQPATLELETLVSVLSELPALREAGVINDASYRAMQDRYERQLQEVRTGPYRRWVKESRAHQQEPSTASKSEPFWKFFFEVWFAGAWSAARGPFISDEQQAEGEEDPLEVVRPIFFILAVIINGISLLVIIVAALVLFPIARLVVTLVLAAWVSYWLLFR